MTERMATKCAKVIKFLEVQFFCLGDFEFLIMFSQQSWNVCLWILGLGKENFIKRSSGSFCGML